MVPELASLGSHCAAPQGHGRGRSWQDHGTEGGSVGGLWHVPSLRPLKLPFHRTSTRRSTARPCTSGEHSPGNSSSTWAGLSRAFPVGWGWRSALRGRLMALCAQTTLTVVPQARLCHSQVPVQAEGSAHQLRELHGGSLHAAAARPAAHGGHGGLRGALRRGQLCGLGVTGPCSLVQWSEESNAAPVPGPHGLHMHTQRQLKEALYNQIIEYFDQGKVSVATCLCRPCSLEILQLERAGLGQAWPPCHHCPLF